MSEKCARRARRSSRRLRRTSAPPSPAEGDGHSSTQIPRPRVTEYNVVTAVPVSKSGKAGPPAGAAARYDVVFILGVPGISSVMTSLNFDDLLTEGDSLLVGNGLQVDLPVPEGSAPNVAAIVPNAQGRLAQVRLTVTGTDASSAEKEAHDEVMPVLSWIALEADTPLEVKAVVMTDQATQIRRMGATLVGTVQPAPEFAGPLTPELRPFLAAYREGLNSTAPLYQALSFYKVIEGVASFRKHRRRAIVKGDTTVNLDPLSGRIPADASDLPVVTPWACSVFTPYLGMTFAEIKGAAENPIRNAVVHLTPGRDIRVADYFADVRACQDIIPILRYVARALIKDELAWSSPFHSPASRAEP